MLGNHTRAGSVDPGRELARLMRYWRERLDPKEIPGHLSRYPNRRRSIVSQEEIAGLIGKTSAWYGKLERGDREHFSDDFLDRVAIALRLSDNERTLLYLYAVEREPAHRAHPRASPTGSLARVVRTQRWPTYLSDDAWDIVEYNEIAREWFPWIAYEGNLMRWVFTYPEARQQLHRWETDWAPLMLAQMRMASARQRDNERLNELIATILEDSPEARRFWQEEPAAYVHPDGDRRQLHLPYHREVITVEIVALSPMRDPNFRLVMLIPDGDAARAEPGSRAGNGTLPDGTPV